MVTVLANLSAGYDDSGSDEPLSLQEAMTSPYWKTLRRPCMLSFSLLLRMILGSIKMHPQAEQF